MEMEHINENTIKVTIATSDLEERGITFFELLGSQKKVESFFYSILEEVGVRHEFEGIDAVTFQVVPKTDGLDLYITKGMVDNLKDFLKSSPSDKLDSETPLDEVIQQIEKTAEEEIEDTQTKQSRNAKANRRIYDFQVFVFDDLSQYIALAKSLPSPEIGVNHLYFYEGKYYWSHKPENSPTREYIYYQAIEHGVPSNLSNAFLNEYAQHIMETDALLMVRKYFG